MVGRPRLLVFIVAFHAERTLRSVLERIPETLFHNFDCHVLVADDSSTDQTSEIGRQFGALRSDLPLTVLKNRLNQGYGGNQKVGYTFAIANGFDFVALLHGDGQYAPEELPNLVAPLVGGDADAVFGSRMMSGFGALRGGMPLYKYVGNRILSFAQNRLLGMQLSEFHSGYRVYRVATLKRIPFLLNTNDFHFDTEIILQLLDAGARIRERPIPTYYGDEICRVNGIAYAGNVMLASVKYVTHRIGLLYERRFDTRPDDNTHYSLKLGYASSHTYALDAVPPGAHVLDLGAGPGGLARELSKTAASVAVVDAHSPETVTPGVEVHVGDLNTDLRFPLDGVDHILMLDVIEHLADPEAFLDRLRAQFDWTPRTLVLTTGNVAFIITRLMLLAGQFNYGKAGILDRTHTRLFTFNSLRRLLDDAGFKILEVRGIPAPFPKALGPGALGRLLLGINLAMIRIWPGMFSYQIFIKAECRPTAGFVLANSSTAAAAGAETPGW